ncbi:MAG TPA: glycosyltransferase [Gemmatimonadaceae bacterium]|nr:glycosyltransferase [Gemmatimonadaceae bacterium]
MRLACLAASPVYYQAPLYRRIAADPRIEFTAIFASTAGATRPLVHGYGQPVEWGVDPLDGYKSIFLRRADRNPPNGGVLALRDLDVITLLIRERYDVLWLHGYHTVTHLAAALTQRLLGGSRLFREEQTLLSPRPRWKTAIKAIGLPTLFRGSYGLFIGTENRRWFMRWGLSEQRLFHAPYVVDNEAFKAAARELEPRRQQIRADLGIDSGSGPIILSVSRLISKKQPLHLLEAFRRVREKHQCTLLIVGSGPLERKLREKVAAERMPDVVFAGFLDQNEISRAYVAADIFALVSSHNETWGLVVNEAMNFGLPIVVSDRVGSASDLVQGGHNGCVVPYNDIDALVAALERLVVSPDLRAQFARASLDTIAPRTYEVTADGVVAAVRAAVGEYRWALANSYGREGMRA